MTSQAEYLVTLPLGQISGVKREGIYGDIYYSFEGIPYAKPPLGKLRFKAPQPLEPWKGTLDCSHYKSKPTQRNVFTRQVEGGEDCLYLNVYAKTLYSAKPLPVMVWIYGGGFYTGEASRELNSPDYFMREDVVLVTLNYRLCSLGFLCLKDEELQVPGNAALKDQVMALRWVKDNIALFNGDNDNITVFGESAGGASTHYMATTEQTRDLFHKFILMSGCNLNSWAVMEQNDLPYRLAKFHGYQGENIDRQVLEFLQTLEPSQLVDHDLITDQDRRKGMLFSFGPVIEPYVGKDCVIPKPPLEMCRTAWSHRIPLMIGGTSFEGLLMYFRLKSVPQLMSLVKARPDRLLPYELSEPMTEEEKARLGQKLYELHIGDHEPTEGDMLKLLDLMSYKMFWHGLYRVCMNRLVHASAPTYQYRFDFDSPDFNFYRKKFCGDYEVRGVAHADDLCYLFYAREAWKLPLNSPEFKTIRRMIAIWTAFAKNSDPNCREIQPAIWQPLQNSNPFMALNISNDVKFIELPEREKLEVWNTLYKSNDELY